MCISVLGVVKSLPTIVTIVNRKILADNNRVFSYTLLIAHFLLPLQLFLLSLSGLLLNAYF